MFTLAGDRYRDVNEHPDHCPVCGSRVDPGSGLHNPPCPRCGHLLWFSSECVGDVTVVHLTDNRIAVMELLDLLDIAVLDGSVGKLLLDFRGIQTVSSAALGKMVKLIGRARSVSGRLALCRLHPDLRQVLRITRLDLIFDIHESEAEALAALEAVPIAQEH
jgi:anti-sigma B factor antagonist